MWSAGNGETKVSGCGNDSTPPPSVHATESPTSITLRGRAGTAGTVVAGAAPVAAGVVTVGATVAPGAAVTAPAGSIDGNEVGGPMNAGAGAAPTALAPPTEA